MAYTDQATLALDDTFRSRVRVALMTAATQVMGEAKANYSDTQFGKRQDLAYRVLASAGSGMYLEAFVWATVANPEVVAASPDDTIQFQVNAVWGDMSGVRITD